jgi:hypothetical protein
MVAALSVHGPTYSQMPVLLGFPSSLIETAPFRVAPCGALFWNHILQGSSCRGRALSLEKHRLRYVVMMNTSSRVLISYENIRNGIRDTRHHRVLLFFFAPHRLFYKNSLTVRQGSYRKDENYIRRCVLDGIFLKTCIGDAVLI